MLSASIVQIQIQCVLATKKHMLATFVHKCPKMCSQSDSAGRLLWATKLSLKRWGSCAKPKLLARYAHACRLLLQLFFFQLFSSAPLFNRLHATAVGASRLPAALAQVSFAYYVAHFTNLLPVFHFNIALICLLITTTVYVLIYENALYERRITFLLQ